MNVLRFFLPEGSEDSPEAAAAKRKPLVALSRDLFVEYFNIVRWGWGRGVRPRL